MLNICRYVLPAIAVYFILGDTEPMLQTCLIISCYIMQFAGLAFLAMGCLKKLHAGDGAIFAVSIMMSILGSVLEGSPDQQLFRQSALRLLLVY